MKVVRDNDVATFLSAAGPLLYGKEAEYSLILGLAEAVAAGPVGEYPPLFLRLERERRTIAVALQTRPETLAVTALTPEEIPPVSEFLWSRNLNIQGIVGPFPSTQGLANHYAKLMATEASLIMGQRILRAERVVPPRPSSGGGPQTAGAADIDLVYEFMAAFHAECVPHDPFTPHKMRALFLRKIAQAEVFLWKVGDRVVSTTQIGRPTRSGISVSAVYTPPVYRGHGYASNLVAEVTRQQLRQGRRFCVLYTDAGNPTSNKIYQSVGYEVVGASEYYRTGVRLSV